ncbi:hypothetical protein CYMTET_52243 [Cymbomonas tetramitiformis]|uniref:WW domain-containing protein n=1 Tax=Cymbomonas tetramitiformis TaxID=36881 RepID=A0AAE0ERJ4_9CHLO|nr:hypothetical protein CYMTET_52243 [Cymbomonas tetramitiformis]
MEKHHRLRRDPSWSPHGCNICGQEGHQAANCVNGTVNWREKFGDDAFVIKDESNLYATPTEPDYEEMAERAKAYAAAKRAADAKVDMGIVTQEATQIAAVLLNTPAPVIPEAAQTAPGPAPVAAPAAGAPGAPPPAGASPWQTFYDQMGRPYYFNPTTQVTQWEAPPELRGVGGAPPGPAPGAVPATGP